MDGWIRRGRKWQARNSPRMHAFILSDQIIELAIILIERTRTKCSIEFFFPIMHVWKRTFVANAVYPSRLVCQHFNGQCALLLMLWDHNKPPSSSFTQKKIDTSTHTQSIILINWLDSIVLKLNKSKSNCHRNTSSWLG